MLLLIYSILKAIKNNTESSQVEKLVLCYGRPSLPCLLQPRPRHCHDAMDGVTTIVMHQIYFLNLSLLQSKRITWLVICSAESEISLCCAKQRLECENRYTHQVNTFWYCSVVTLDGHSSKLHLHTPHSNHEMSNTHELKSH